jgi:L-malate glycosyltransferase
MRSLPAERIRVLSFLPNLCAGGTERHVVTLTRSLDPARFEPHVACLTRRGEFLGEVESRGIPVQEYAIRKLYGARAVRQQFRFATYLRSRRIHIVHTYSFYSHVFAIPAARLARTPAIVASIRDSGDVWTPAQRRVQHGVCRLADWVLTNAEAVKQRLVSEGYAAPNITVIRNGVDLKRFAQPAAGVLRRELSLPSDAPVVAMVSRLHRARGVDFKGVEYFLQAAQRVSAERPGVRFVVFGDGPSRPQYEGDAARLGLGNRLVFAGFRFDVPEALKEVTISVLPSLSEGLSNAILESMAAGVPVVATDVGGNPELVEDGVNGLLVPPRDSGELFRAMSLLLDRPDLARRFGEAGRRRAIAQFSLGRMVQDTERLYADLLQRRAPGAAYPVGSLSETH